MNQTRYHRCGGAGVPGDTLVELLWFDRGDTTVVTLQWRRYYPYGSEGVTGDTMIRVIPLLCYYNRGETTVVMVQVSGKYQLGGVGVTGDPPLTIDMIPLRWRILEFKAIPSLWWCRCHWRYLLLSSWATVASPASTPPWLSSAAAYCVAVDGHRLNVTSHQVPTSTSTPAHKSYISWWCRHTYPGGTVKGVLVLQVEEGDCGSLRNQVPTVREIQVHPCGHGATLHQCTSW